MAHPDLRGLYERRQASKSFKMRDGAYKLTEMIYNSIDPHNQEALQLSYRPYLQDKLDMSGSEGVKPVVNQTRVVVNHHASMFAHPPRAWAIPYSNDDKEAADKRTALAHSIFRRSNLGTLHPRNAHWLSLRGDCVFAADYRVRDAGIEKAGVFVRTYDPAWCYPSFSPDDLGACMDMLIVFEVHPAWAKATYKLSDLEDNRMAQVFHYWTDNDFWLQVNDQPVPAMHREHKLGVVPFRWVFGDPSGLMAQSDVREIPKLQELYNENLLLAIDAIRKQVDPAYWATGLKKNVSPVPGEATALPEGAKIGEWPTGGDPQIILGMMHAVEAAIQQIAGLSPISATGQATDSIVTGSAVRHQVEAAEARTETRKAMLQTTYAKLMELTLRIAKEKFADLDLTFRAPGGIQKMKGVDIGDWLECEAEYGGFLSLPFPDRVRTSLEGLGRVWDGETAVKLIDMPGVEPRDMMLRINDYQIDQAKVTAEAQAAAQKAAQGDQPPGAAPAPGMAGGMPQKPMAPKPPPFGALQEALAKHAGKNGRVPA